MDANLIVEWFRLVFLIVVSMFCLFACASFLIKSKRTEEEDVAIIIYVLYSITNILILTYGKNCLWLLVPITLIHLLLIISIKKFLKNTDNLKDFIKEDQEVLLSIKAIEVIKLFCYLGLFTYLMMTAKRIGEI